ncbi:MAG: metallophosphoesterase family protein [Actinomycetota bacterium]
MPFVLAGCTGGAAAVTLLLAVTAVTFDAAAFQEPRYTGALVSAPDVLAAFDRSIGSIDELRSRYEATAARLARLLALAAAPDPDLDGAAVALLHVSDIHSNPLAFEVVEQLAREFEVDAVIDTGDVTSFGAPVEGRIGALIRDVGVPYLYVPGNHDSEANRRALDRVDNVRLLDGDAATIRGVDVMGFADPTFTASNEVSTEEGNEARLEAAEALAREVRAAAPDVLAVHDERLGRSSIGSVPLVLAGHTHQRSFEDRDGTLVLTVGSTGATGVGSFTVEADLDLEAEILYLNDGRLVAFDYVSIGGLGSDFEVERRTVEQTDGDAGAAIMPPRSSANLQAPARRRARAAEGSALLMR